MSNEWQGQATEDTAMPFPYPKIMIGGYGNAVSLPQNPHQRSRDM